MKKLPVLMCVSIAVAFLLFIPPPQAKAQNEVPLYVAFVLHFHQPVYHPGVPLSWDYFDTPTDPGSSVTVRQVFEDCGFCYRRPATLVNTYPEVKLSVHFTGSLIWQLDWLSQNGFSSKGTSLEGIWDEYEQAIQTGRLEVLVDGFYHPIFPLIERDDANIHFTKMLNWYNAYFQTEPRGFFTPEMGFDMHVIPWLANDFGVEWTLFDSFNIEGLPNYDKWTQEYCETAFRPHLAEYGGVAIIVIPREHHLGQNQSDGFDPNYLVQELEKIQQWNTDPSRPLLVVIVSDGENGWMRQAGGGYYDWFWPGFIDALSDPSNSWIKLTTISEYLGEVYTPTDYIQINQGSWGVGGADWDLSTWNGSALDNEMWARIDNVRQELFDYEQSVSGSLAESYMARAWGYFVMAETSCYWFWDTNEWAQKSYTALDLAIQAAENAVANSGKSGEVPDELGLTGVALPPDFSISVSPLSGSVQTGDSLNITVDIVAFRGYENSIVLGASGQPSGVGISFSPNTGTPSFSSTMTISVGDNAPMGDYTLTIQGIGGDGKEHSCNFSLTITSENVEGDFSVSVNPSGVSVRQGGASTVTVSVEAVRGYENSVDLSVSGQPSGVDISFDPENGTPSFTSTMTISVSDGATVGTHALTIKGIGADGREDTCSFSLTITSENVEGDFSISVSPSSGSVMRENSLTILVSVKITGDYSDIITLSASGQPSGVNITFSPGTGTQNFSSLMTIRTSSTAPIGTHPITVKGTGRDGKEHTTGYSLTITAPVIPPEIQRTRWLISEGKVKITCEIKGEVTSVVVRWRVDGETQETTMTCVDDVAGKWVAEIGPFETDTEMNFSLYAAGAGGEAWDLGATEQGYDVSIVGTQPEAEIYPLWPIVGTIVAIAGVLGFIIFRRKLSRSKHSEGKIVTARP